MAKGRQQYFADEVSIQKEAREFAIEEQLKAKIDSVEEGAQVNTIETVKVNGEALIPDEEKAVDVDVPLVEDNLYSVDTEAALSARQGKVLYEYIQNLQSRGRYLSNWNSATGLPTTNPSESPYVYRSGDYFLVSNVSTGTNYKPDGAQYEIGVASEAVETDTVMVSDMYIYDGANWQLIKNGERPIVIDDRMDIASTNPVENRVITQALRTKQDTISDLQTIREGAALGATSLQPGDSITELTGTSDNITEGTSHLFMTPQERTKLGNQTGVNTGDETQATIMAKLGAASATTNGYLTSADWNTFNNKQDAISDLQTIRDNAQAGKSASDTIATYGDIVTHNVNEFATAAQGAKADTALQSGDNVSELVNDAGYITDAYHDNTKQDVLTLGTNLAWGSNGELNANDTTYVAGDFDIKDLADSTGLRAEWTGKQDALTLGANLSWGTNGELNAADTKYTAGPGISISANNVISNTQTSAEWGNIQGTLSNQTDLQNALDEKQDELTAGENITIENVCESDMQGPCPSGFHIPTQTQWETVANIMSGLSFGNSGDARRIYLHMPFTGARSNSTTNINSQGSRGQYWASNNTGLTSAVASFRLRLYSYAVYYFDTDVRARANAIRAFKNTPMAPDNTWTTIYDGSSIAAGAGIFHNAVEGLISLSSDGTHWVTIADKNVGATAIYNDGDTLTQDNMGNFYQRGNNYGFPTVGTISNTSSTQVDASTYGPGNYYNSSTFIIGNEDWSSVRNDNLWGGVTQGQQCALKISATDTTYTAGTGISIVDGVISSTQTSAEWGNITGTLSSQTDLQNELDAKQDTLVSGTNIKTINNTSILGSGDITISAPTYTAGTGIDITNDEISVDNTVAMATDVNTKTFYLSSTSDLTVAQAAYDWYLAGKNPIIMYDNTTYILKSVSANRAEFRSLKTSLNTRSDGTSHSSVAYVDFILNNSTTVTSIADGYVSVSGPYIATDINYSNPYIPQYDGNPATKKYVDDSISAISITPAWGDITGTLADQTDLQAALDAKQDNMVVLSYGNSTWNDFLTAYQNNAVVYCRASSGSNPGSGTQGRLAFMAYVNNAENPTEVEFQYYRSRSNHDSAANQLDEVYVYKLVPASGGTWTVTIRNTAAKAVAGTGIGLTFGGGGNMTISNTGVTSVNGQTGTVTTPTYSAGTGLTLNNNEFAVDTTTIATKADLANFAGFQVVAQLPTTDIKTNIIYLLGPVGTGADKYEEYIYSNNAWIMIGDTTIDLSPYLNVNTQTSDAITEGSTNLFLTTAERTKLGNTSGTNTGDETKATIQSKLGAASSSNSGYLTSADYDTFMAKANPSDVNTKTFYLQSDSDTTTAQEAIDWIRAGNTAILKLKVGNQDYYYYYSYADWSMTSIYHFVRTDNLLVGAVDGASTSHQKYSVLNISVDMNQSTPTVTSIYVGDVAQEDFEVLRTGYNYPTPYTPQYDGSPATKKYVDDAVAGGGGYRPIFFAGSSLADIGAALANYLNTYSITPSNLSDVGPIGVWEDGPYYLQGTPVITTDVQYRFTFQSPTTTTSTRNNSYTWTTHPLRRFVMDWDSTNSVWSYNSSDTSYVQVTSYNYLRTDVNYATPYTPQYNGSPATKKYVDDTVAASISSAITNETAGTTSSINKIWVGTEAEYQAITTYDEHTAYMTF